MCGVSVLEENPEPEQISGNTKSFIESIENEVQ
jgi:hypothetical protein